MPYVTTYERSLSGDATEGFCVSENPWQTRKSRRRCAYWIMKEELANHKIKSLVSPWADMYFRLAATKKPSNEPLRKVKTYYFSVSECGSFL